LRWLQSGRNFDEPATLSTMAAFTTRSLTIADGAGDPERYPGAAVSSNLFDILGAPPVLGRNFTADDDRPGAEPVILLSDEVWHRRYNADPQIVGRAISVKSLVACLFSNRCRSGV
jgi:putative ABC transport system permease protein